MMSSARKTRIALLAILVTVSLSGFLAWKLDLHEISTEQVRSWGIPAMMGYTLVLVILGGLGVPPLLFIMPSIAIWPFPVAFVICMTGGLGASLFGFLLSRYCLRETVTPRIPEKISRYEHRLETHGISTVLILRLLFYLFPPINWMLGISAIPISVFLGATLVGMLPGTLVYLLTGTGLLGFLRTLDPVELVVTFISSAVGLVLWFRWAMR